MGFLEERPFQRYFKRVGCPSQCLAPQFLAITNRDTRTLGDSSFLAGAWSFFFFILPLYVFLLLDLKNCDLYLGN